MGAIKTRLVNHVNLACNARLMIKKSDLRVLSDTELLRSYLSERLGVKVMNFHITEFDYDNDPAQIDVYYRNKEIPAPQFLKTGRKSLADYCRDLTPLLLSA